MAEAKLSTTEISNLADLPWVSDLMVERLSASGDTTGIPYYHYRWKKKWLADYVAWPTTSEEVSEIMRYATKHRIPVTPRGGGSCYFGSASPTRGGIILDTKRMGKIIHINHVDNWVHVQAGAVWEKLEIELAKRRLSLPVAPQSATASTLAGWLAIGGKAGIGTAKYGSILENLLEMEVVRPNGTIETITGEDMKLFYGTSGIAGVVTAVKMKVRTLPEHVAGIMFAFESLETGIDAVNRLGKSGARPIYLRLTDLEYEWRAQGGLPPDVTGNFFVQVVYDGLEADVEKDVKAARGIMEVAGGQELGQEYYERNWEDRFIVEMKLKLEVPTLSMQNFWIPLNDITPIVNQMYKIARNYKINSCFYLVFGKEPMVRLCVFAPSDHRHWMHFMAGKAMLHRIVKMNYKHNGELYTLGLQNSVYVKKFQPDDHKHYAEIRREWDPSGIMNPDKLTRTNLTYRRMNLMFTMNGYFRRLQTLFRMGRHILEIPASVKEGHK
ncbi:MAG: FAD-binding oxidoreductase [Candidatus Thorarchaeota archaeon]|jgi:FAD/FMN-containing dehydrogenase